MLIENKILKVYMRRLKFFFIVDWVILFLSCILLSYSLLNYYFKNLFIFFSIEPKSCLIISFIGIFYFILKFFISITLKSRLIIGVLKNDACYSLINYNNSIISVDKSQISIESEFNDFFLNQLFGNTAMIHLKRTKCEKLLLCINNKKYYLIPSLFEHIVAWDFLKA
jgi:hypothetical protein